MSGWVTMHRGWRDCDAFDEPTDPMSDADAWFWLIEHSAWKALRRKGGQGQSISIERGQIHVSDRSLATAFRWDKKRVRRYLEKLEHHKMIILERDQSGTTLSICNYDKYQQIKETEGPAKDQSGTTQEQRKQDSSSNEEGVPPVNIVKAIFDLGVTLLTASGQTDRAARSIVGRWRKAYGDGGTMEALAACQAKSITNPVEWVPRFMNGRAQSDQQQSMTAQILARKQAA